MIEWNYFLKSVMETIMSKGGYLWYLDNLIIIKCFDTSFSEKAIKLNSEHNLNIVQEKSK